MSNETVIIPKIVVLEPRILYDLDRQPSKFNSSSKQNLFQNGICASLYHMTLTPFLLGKHQRK